MLISAAERSYQAIQAEVQRRSKIAKYRPVKYRNRSTAANMKSTLNQLREHANAAARRKAQFHGMILNHRLKLPPIYEATNKKARNLWQGGLRLGDRLLFLRGV